MAIDTVNTEIAKSESNVESDKADVVPQAVSSDRKLSGLVIARVVGLSGDSVKILYSIFQELYCQDAIAVIGQPMSTDDIGCDVCIAFAGNDFDKPIILGKMFSGHSTKPELNLESDSQITLRCGKASISLKSDGTVAIRGTNVASRASQTNRIRGGNVQIN